ncbi:MAG: hypothetical protein JWQ04_2068 [Pedosphaera sp.]|nr:hypothetical protein [Pedosphaera sp.]
MKKFKPSNALFQTILAAVILVVTIGGLAATLCLADPKSDALPPKTDPAPAKTNSVPQLPSAPDTKQFVPKRQLSGAELYSMHCNRCHPERYPTERTAAQWRTILLHMRVRANLPAEQARTILKYLQDNSGR